MSMIFSLVLILIVSASSNTPATAQQQIPRIGLLSNGSIRGYEQHRQELLLGLEELGYVEGKNILIDYRYTEGKRNLLPRLAAELLASEVSMILAIGPHSTAYAIQSTKKVPIIMVGSGNAIGRGFVKSLSEPGGNVTGLSSFIEGEDAKRMEMFLETIPSMSRITVLNSRPRRASVEAYQETGTYLGLAVDVVKFKGVDGIGKALAKVTDIHPDGLIIVPHTSTLRNMVAIANYAREKQLPSLLPRREYVEAGGLMSFDINRLNLWRRAAVYVDKILRGANPATLPVEPPQLELVINLKTAVKIGVTIPPEILLEANEVVK